VIGVAIDNIDDLWTNIFLGDLALGFYSKAYKFASYPRTILALPIQKVSTGIYSELKYDRIGLSKAFFRTSALLVRTGFLLSGWLALIAPEFIMIFLGEKWMPMLDAFRLMLVFAMFDPLKGIIGDVLVAIGKPQKLIQTRFMQIVLLVLGLFTLGYRFGISGVALSVNLMLVAGIILLLYFVNPHIDFSLLRLFGAPIIAMILALGGTLLVQRFWEFQFSFWVTGFIKSVSFTGIFLASLYLIEGRILYLSIKEVVYASSVLENVILFFKCPFNRN
jgi:PST family polysaccharide transporter/lipopolysaccharide exporter